MRLKNISKKIEMLVESRNKLIKSGESIEDINKEISRLEKRYSSILSEDTSAGKSVKDINFIIDEKEKEYSSYLVEDTQSTNIDVGKDIPTSISNELNRVLSFKKFFKK